MTLPRGTDIDVDGAGRLYLSSWAGGEFSYTDAERRLRHPAVAEGCDGRRVSEPARRERRGAARASRVGQRRVAGRRRSARCSSAGTSRSSATGLVEACGGERPEPRRGAAAIFTLKLLGGAAADMTLIDLCAKEDVREFALRALADRKGDAMVPADPFLKALRDPNPRVRLIAAWGLGRLGHADAPEALVPLTADADPLVAHVAINSLVGLKAVDACLAAISDGDDEARRRRGKRVAAAARCGRRRRARRPARSGEVAGGPRADLPRAVRGSISARRRGTASGGARGRTRPGRTSSRSRGRRRRASPSVIRRALKSEPPAIVRALLIDCGANRVDLAEVNDRLLAVDPKDPQLCLALLDTLVRQRYLSEPQSRRRERS